MIDLWILLIARPAARAISEKRLLVLKHAIHHNALDRGIAFAVHSDEARKLLLARQGFELASLALGHKIALDAIAHRHRRLRRAILRPRVARARLEHDAIGRGGLWG